MSLLLSSRPVIFGEVLFDVFSDGAAVLGGAPFNVAWNLKGFGLDPVFISAVGDDERGEAVLKAMRGWGMDTGAVQVDDKHPTGVVDVSVENGQPSFSILDHQAYDFISESMADKSLENGRFSIFYHGSLIARSEMSRRTLYSLRESLGLSLFIDVNLRPPWWDSKSVFDAINMARWVKLNSDELCDLLEQSLDSK
ncbi:Fructokinase, partial [hydrothermal vent metagenome]